LILLFLFNTRYRPIELVDTKKKRKDISFDNIDLNNNDLEIVNNNNTFIINKNNNNFSTKNNQEFGNYKDYIFESNITINRIRENIR
jgi:hypothetical protein